MRLVGQLSLVGSAMKPSARNAALASGKGAGSSWRRWGTTRFSLATGFCHARGVSGSATTRASLVGNSPPLRVSLEGNIASGKSTLLEILGSKFRLQIVPEPVSRWQNVTSDGGNETGGNLLELFYSDPKRWAYTFQSYAFLSRLQAQIAPIEAADGESSLVVYERSVFSDKHIFGTNCREMGLFNDVEWGIYNDYHKWLVSSFDVKLDAVIYLRTSPETCMTRLKKRSRSEEETIAEDYLKAIHQRHEHWLCPQGGLPADWCGTTPPKLLVIDCDEEFAENEARRSQLLHEISKFLEECRN